MTAPTAKPNPTLQRIDETLHALRDSEQGTPAASARALLSDLRKLLPVMGLVRFVGARHGSSPAASRSSRLQRGSVASSADLRDARCLE